jgi:hypothetical protein
MTGIPELDPIEMRRIAIKAATNRHGVFCPVPELQAECAVIGHDFEIFKPSAGDPLGQLGIILDECVYCGWKE